MDTLASEASARYRDHMRASRTWGAPKREDVVGTGCGAPAPADVRPRTRATIEQDPAFDLRILVDIAIRALSPVVHHPTTAVRVLDYIQDLLLVIGRHGLHGHGEVVMGRPGPGP